MKKDKDKYLDTFIFPDIPWQLYPVYSVSEKGNIYNLKNIIYPSPKSAKRFTRNKQLKFRSLQAKLFDAFIRIGYFDPLTDYIAKEFPIIIQNSLRSNLGIDNGYFLLDYFFANLKNDNFWGLDIELDSDLHLPEKDKIRDKYLEEQLKIKVFRIKNLEKPSVQETKFKELAAFMRTMTPTKTPRVFSFQDEVRIKLNHEA